MIIPYSKTIHFFEAIITLSRSYDDISFCRTCKCFFRNDKIPSNHEPENCDMTIRDMMGMYKIFTREEMHEAINNFYNNFDITYITEDGWKQLQIDTSSTCYSQNKNIAKSATPNKEYRNMKKLLKKGERNRIAYQKAFKEQNKEINKLKQYIQELTKAREESQNDMQAMMAKMRQDFDEKYKETQDKNKFTQDWLIEQHDKTCQSFSETYSCITDIPGLETFEKCREKAEGKIKDMIEVHAPFGFNMARAERLKHTQRKKNKMQFVWQSTLIRRSNSVKSMSVEQIEDTSKSWPPGLKQSDGYTTTKSSLSLPKNNSTKDKKFIEGKKEAIEFCQVYNIINDDNEMKENKKCENIFNSQILKGNSGDVESTMKCNSYKFPKNNTIDSEKTVYEFEDADLRNKITTHHEGRPHVYYPYLFDDIRKQKFV